MPNILKDLFSPGREVELADLVGEIGDILGLEILLPMQFHSSANVRNAAAKSLEIIGNKNDLMGGDLIGPIELFSIAIDLMRGEDSFSIDGEVISYDPWDFEFYADTINEQAYKVLWSKLKEKVKSVEGVLPVMMKLSTMSSLIPKWPEQNFGTVLRELIRNAVQHGDAVTNGTMRQVSTIELKAEIDSVGQFILTVCDDGSKGLDEKEKIFERGFTTRKSKRENPGFGLYLSREFVKKVIGNGANIFAYDNLRDLKLSHSGATFKVIIPIAEVNQKESTPKVNPKEIYRKIEDVIIAWANSKK